MKEAGLIQELSIETDQARFDPNMKPHTHLVCLQCKSINDCTDPMVSETVEHMDCHVWRYGLSERYVREHTEKQAHRKLNDELPTHDN